MTGDRSESLDLLRHAHQVQIHDRLRLGVLECVVCLHMLGSVRLNQSGQVLLGDMCALGYRGGRA